MTKIFKIIILSLFPLFIMGVPHQSFAAKIDVYLVYSSTEKSIARAIKKELSGDFKVRTYNVDLLALADYSGKQKVTLKLAKAKVVVLIQDKPKDILSNASFKTVVEITDENDLNKILEELQ